MLVFEGVIQAHPFFFTERRSEADSYEDPKSWGNLDEISRRPKCQPFLNRWGDVEISETTTCQEAIPKINNRLPTIHFQVQTCC